MHLSYEKLGLDHPMYGKAEYIVMDQLQAVCYKTKEGYLPIESKTNSSTAQNSIEVKSHSLYVLSFKMNDEAEEMTFKSKKKHDKAQSFFSTKDYITDIQTTVYKTLD